MGGFLEKILKEKSRSLRKDPGYVRTLEEKIEGARPPRDFLSITGKPQPRIIAEVKRASPSAGKIREVDPVEQAKIYERCGAVAVSVLTEEVFFEGSLRDLERVSLSVSLPVLRKDFIIDEVHILEARASGADSVLLIVRILEDKKLKDLIALSEELGMKPLVEVFSYEEALRAVEAGAEVIGINSRDLETLEVDTGRVLHLAPKLKDLGVPFVVGESGVESREQVEEFISAGVDAVLVGTALMRSEDPCGKLTELRGQTPRSGNII